MVREQGDIGKRVIAGDIFVAIGFVGIERVGVVVTKPSMRALPSRSTELTGIRRRRCRTPLTMEYLLEPQYE